MDIFLESIGVCDGFRAIPGRLNRINLFCKGDAPSVKETKEEQALADVAQQKWQYYQDNYRPLEDTYMKQVDGLNTDGARDFASGVAGSSTAAAFDNSRKQVAGALESGGINPNSGRFQSAMSGLSDAQAMSASDSKAMAKNSVDDQYVGGLQNVSAIGRGQATTAQAGLSDLASSAANKASNDAEIAFNNQAANLNAAGSLAGAGLYAYDKKSSPSINKTAYQGRITDSSGFDASGVA